ncbi:MAG TPA: TIGR02147 family protein [Armatimonadota bacterium]|nr:TIGR02147 family protein [Armatimonadota bacterium]
MTTKNINIYQYNSYRDYLRDFFEQQRSSKYCFSLRYFARRAGLRSHSYLIYLLSGKRNLAEESIENFIHALALTGKSAEYFRVLVNFTQTASLARKESLFQQMNLLRRHTAFYRVADKQYAYFEQWYHSVIRELAVLVNWQGDYARLGAHCDPPISAAQAKKSVALLLSIGLLEKSKDGRFTQSASTVTADGIPLHLLRKAQRTLITMAADAVERFGPESRNISAATLALSKASFTALSAELDALRRKALALYADEPGADVVYQLNFQLFPLSKNPALTPDPEPGDSR